MKTLLAIILFSALPLMAADVYTFSISPAENVSGPSGLVTGWGYTLQNQSSTDWLVATGLNAGTFQFATPQLIFDFPDVAPGASVRVSYDPVKPTGLYQIHWDANAPTNFVNSGLFTLSAEWWNGDPASRGTRVGIAPDSTQPYTAKVTATPEPGTLRLLALVGLGFLATSKSINKRTIKPF